MYRKQRLADVRNLCIKYQVLTFLEDAGIVVLYGKYMGQRFPRAGSVAPILIFWVLLLGLGTQEQVPSSLA